MHLFTFDPRWLAPTIVQGEKPIIFFDGICGLCNHFIDFIFREDYSTVFNVAPLQGTLAKSLALQPKNENEGYRSIVLKDEYGIHRGSTAVLRILSRLGGIWRVVSWARLLPKKQRDLVYYFVAKRRYQWFGRKETCRIPSESERKRFLS